MPVPVEEFPFESAAPFYDRFRAPYASAALDYVVQASRLGRNSRILDLGCGPGTLAIPLSRSVAEVVAVDPGTGMLAQARRLASEGDATNIQWVQCRAEDLATAHGTFDLVTMGQSFHWMDRDRVLFHLADFVREGGAIAILDEGRRRPQESWEPAAAQVINRFLGAPERHPQKHREVEHEPSLRRSSHFSEFSRQEFPFELTRDVASILGCVYSSIRVSRSALGEAASQFELELTDALLRESPSGVFKERLETSVLLAPREDTGQIEVSPTPG